MGQIKNIKLHIVTDIKSFPESKMGENAEKKTEEFVIDPEKVLKYTRGKRVKAKHAKDRHLRNKLKNHEQKYEQSVKQAARAEILLTEQSGVLEAEGVERTHHFTQKDIAQSLDITSTQNFFNLKLDQFGPYKISYTRNGKYLLLGGAKGHLAGIDWPTKNPRCEVHARETVRDVTWLHNETMFAAAQKKCVYIYDNQGTEIHCLSDLADVNRLEFLPYHFLLASVAGTGHLRYQDTSTGKMISRIRTKLGRCDCMSQNPMNSVINLGHSNGTVTMWSPVMKEPLVKLQCHRGPVLSTCVEKKGMYMATSGLDGTLKVWDIRAYKPVYTYRMQGRPAHCTAISQKGMLAAAFGSQVYVFKDALTQKQSMPYMKHAIPGCDISGIAFCPYQDVLGVGHAKGFSSLIIPGAGEANFDALESNPFQTKKQRQEHEVKMLLEKIQPEMITLNPEEIREIKSSSGGKKTAEKTDESDSEGEGKEAEAEKEPGFEPKYKMKGRSRSGKVEKRKKGVTENLKREKLKEKVRKEKKMALSGSKKTESSDPGETVSSLDRFKSK